MYQPIELTITIPAPKTLLSARRWGVRSFLLVILASFVFSLTARGVTPAPDGGYPNQNTAEGEDALFSLTGNTLGNTAVGYQALYKTTTGGSNTAIGDQALYTNTIGNFNTASGGFALFSNLSGSYNTAHGYTALFGNTTGIYNAADGYAALSSNNTGQSNTANGYFALGSNSSGDNNTATGYTALQNNTTAVENTATGNAALFSNTEGNQNTASGTQALYSNTTGYNNTADGSFALLSNTTGAYNIALGFLAGSNLTTGSNNIDIGHPGVAGEGNHIRIGTKGTHRAIFVAGIYGTTIASGAQVIVGSGGKLGTIQSSARFKEAVRPMEKASEAILALKPVTFRYKHELDPESIPQFGLVAEEVEKVNPALVARDDEGKAYTVRYEAVNAMLLNEFLKEHRKVGELEAIAAQQQKEIKELAGTLKKQASQIQKVSQQLARSRLAPQLVAANQ